MEPTHVQRLKEEQEAAIADSRARIQALEKFRVDYKVLQERLRTLPEKVTHNVMVPFGKLAFMPGQLVHTNEVTVLLGDNWFAERSAKQSCDIIERRIKAVDEQIGGLQKQASLLEPRVDFTDELSNLAQQKGDVFEIREDYDEEKEKIWKAEHRERMKQYRHELRETEKRERQRQEEEPHSDAELWLRLDELEEQESHQKEMEQMDEANEDVPQVGAGVSRLIDSDTDDEGDEDYDEDEDDDEEDNNEPATRPSTITFHHTQVSQVREGASGSTGSSASPSADQIVTSPADIFPRFGTTSQRSILKSAEAPGDKRERHVRIALPEETGKKASSTKEKPEQILMVSPAVQKAFTGTIVERPGSLDRTAQATCEGRAEDVPQRVSRFKAQRRQQNEGKT